MFKFFRYIRSSIGTKQVMAVLGLSLCGFLIMHLAGNLLLLKGADTFNGYAHLLEANPLLIPAELFLLALFVLHMLAAAKMILGNYQARPVSYKASYMETRFWPSSLMIFSAVCLFVFLAVHLWTFKYSPLKYAPNGEMNIHLVVVNCFSNVWYVSFYVLCMALLGLHLFHGFQSAFLTLGLDHPKYTPIIKGVGVLYSVAMAVGFIFIPVYTYLKGGVQ